MWPFTRKPREADVDAEIAAHLAMAVRDRMDRGESLQDAAAAAHRELGNAALVKESTREAWGWSWLENLTRDVQYALRRLRRSPGFTLTAILLLALGIGANTAIFSLINSLILRPLSVSDPQSLVELFQRYPGEPRTNAFTFASFEHYRDSNHVFSAMIGSEGVRLFVQADGNEGRAVSAQYVVRDFFSVLGLKPALGRLISPDDARPGSPTATAAVISWNLWNSQFHLSRDVLGQKILIEGLPFVVAGVAPPEFFGLQVGMRDDLWLPISAQPLLSTRSRLLQGRLPMSLTARLKPGVSLAQAQAEMKVLHQWTLAEFARTSNDPQLQHMGFEIEFAPNGHSVLRDGLSKPIWLLMSGVGALLLILCANLGGMMLARGIAQQRDVALRISLGAAPIRLVRQILVEAMLLSISGAALGIFVAQASARLLARVLVSGRAIIGMPDAVVIPTDIDLRVLIFAASLALAAALLFALIPLIFILGTPPSLALRSGTNAATLRGLLGKCLVAAQVGLSVALLAAAGLFASNLAKLQNLDLGFQRDHRLIVILDPSHAHLPPGALTPRYQQLLARLQSIPGVTNASLSGVTPINGAGASRFVNVEGFTEPSDARRYITLNWIAPAYFATLGTPILAGRDFNAGDQAHPRVAIINRAMARHYFGSANALGKHIALDGEPIPYEIIGVVADTHYYEIREAPPRTMYLYTFQPGPVLGQHFILHTAADPAVIAPAVRSAVRETVPNVPIARITTLDEQIDASIVPERLLAGISTVFGLLAAALVAVGLYGLLAYLVTRRTNEIGIRMALGATQTSITKLVFKEALGMVFAGLALGIPVAFLGRTLAGSIVQDLNPDVTQPLLIAALVIATAAALAVYLPAHRAARIDPNVALHAD